MRAIADALQLLAAISLAHPLAAVAQLASPGGTQATAAPSASGDALRYLLGSWDVTATTPDTGETVSVRYDVRPLVGPWISGRATSRQPGLEASDVWGRDPASGNIIRSIFDGSGTHAVVTSSGWTGQTLVLEGDARSSTGVIRVRETITRRDDEQFTAVWEAYRNDAWRTYSIERAIRRRP